MPPFDFIDVRMCVDDTVEVNVGALADGVRVERSAQDYLRFGCICNRAAVAFASNCARIIVPEPHRPNYTLYHAQNLIMHI